MSLAAECTAKAADDTQELPLTDPPVLLFATVTGVVITNLSASQTLIGHLVSSLGISSSLVGLVSTASLLGYAAGLFLIVPLADRVENRRLALSMLGAAVVAATGTALAPGVVSFLLMLFLLGAACSVIQVLVPIAAAMATPARRGRVVGDIMSGVMIGILLSRPLASLVADFFGWRAFYAGTAALMALLALVLVWRLPENRPDTRTSWPGLVASLWHLFRGEPVLQRHALLASLGMGAFTAFWTAIALRLAQAPFRLDAEGIALFALIGAGGAVAAPLAGRLGDSGLSRVTTIGSHVIVLGSLGVAAVAGDVGEGSMLLPLIGLGVSAFLLDFGVVGDQTIGRRAINMIRPEARGRLNAVFVGLFFMGGAIGSALAGPAWSHGGWPGICALGAVFTIAALLVAFSWRKA